MFKGQNNVSLMFAKAAKVVEHKSVTECEMGVSGNEGRRKQQGHTPEGK